MKRKILLMTVLTLLLMGLMSTVAMAEPGDVEINETNFPDANFREYVKENFDNNDDNKLSQAELDAVTEINYNGYYYPDKKIKDLKGIEHFTNLKELHIGNNSLTELDVSYNPKLEKLSCFTNKIKTLTLGKKLTWIRCNENEIEDLDLSENVNLKYLDCYYNNLVELNLKENILLEELDCRNNDLNSLDLSKNVNLKDLQCYNNNLSELNLSTNIEISKLICAGNQLTTLDLSSNEKLKWLGCENNNLTSLDLSSNENLENLFCQNNNLTSLDLSSNENLENLFCQNNNLTSLDLSKNIKLNEYGIEVGNQVAQNPLSFEKSGGGYEFDFNSLQESFDPSKVIKIELDNGKDVTDYYDKETGILSLKSVGKTKFIKYYYNVDHDKAPEGMEVFVYNTSTISPSIPQKPEKPAEAEKPVEPEKPIETKKPEYTKAHLDFILFGSQDSRKVDRPKTEETVKTEKMELQARLWIGQKNLEKSLNGVVSNIEMDVAPFIVDGRTMVPIRFVAEALGFEVEWIEDTWTVILKDGENLIEIPTKTDKILVNGEEVLKDPRVLLKDNENQIDIPIKTNKIIVNGVVYESDVAPILEDGRTFLPIANVARALGLKDGTDVIWIPETQEVIIKRTIEVNI